MTTAIIYYSKHHGNTKKLVDAIKDSHPEIKTIDITENRVEDLSQYERIGIASGIYGSKFASGLMEYLKDKMPTGKKIFLLYTYAMKMGRYAKDIKALLDPPLTFLTAFIIKFIYDLKSSNLINPVEFLSINLQVTLHLSLSSP